MTIGNFVCVRNFWVLISFYRRARRKTARVFPAFERRVRRASDSEVSVVDALWWSIRRAGGPAAGGGAHLSLRHVCSSLCQNPSTRPGPTLLLRLPISAIKEHRRRSCNIHVIDVNESNNHYGWNADLIFCN